MKALHIAGGLLVAAALAGCASQPLSFSGAEAPPPAPKIAIAGMWTLSSTNGQACSLRLGGTSSPGTVEPGAGCPGKFFTSRQWELTQGRLTIEDYQGQPLVELHQVSPRQFRGKSNSGLNVVLTR